MSVDACFTRVPRTVHAIRSGDKLEGMEDAHAHESDDELLREPGTFEELLALAPQPGARIRFLAKEEVADLERRRAEARARRDARLLAEFRASLRKILDEARSRRIATPLRLFVVVVRDADDEVSAKPPEIVLVGFSQLC